MYSKETQKQNAKMLLSIIAIFVLSAASIVFGVLYISVCGGYIAANAKFFTAISVIVPLLFLVVGVSFACRQNAATVKLILLVLFILPIILFALYVLKISGFWQKISSVEDLREYIAGYGVFAFFVTFLIEFLQVVVLPVPGFVAIGAAVALFGAFKGALISFAGIFSGSVAAFFIGRRLGYKAACWLVGKPSLDKTLQMVKGKDKVVLTFMFLFPFFPDDVLCFVAGLSTMSVKYYLIMIFITRVFSTFTTAYSVDGSIIPYDTWWGIVIWVLLLVSTALISVAVYKNSDKIEDFIKRKFCKPSKQTKRK